MLTMLALLALQMQVHYALETETRMHKSRIQVLTTVFA